MVSREEWLTACERRLNATQDLWHGRTYGAAPTVLPSFPGRSTRTVLLGDIARQEQDNAPVYLVSPLISSSLEVAIVLHWLKVRHVQGGEDARRLTTRTIGERMEWAGFTAPFKQCVPSERLIDRIALAIQPLIDDIGEYPSEDVRLAVRATQTTRLLKVACPAAHAAGDYILRMSQKQFDRGAPGCGVCGRAMVLV